jgi:hypothetical protein
MKLQHFFDEIADFLRKPEIEIDNKNQKTLTTIFHTFKFND